ncbi:MAG: hypothetical protein Q9224_007340, partial [Gallowayella concinna]
SHILLMFRYVLTMKLSAFNSRVFKILVGPTEEAFYAHEDILCKSDVLRMIVRGGGKEQEEGKLLWPDWTVSGAEKFLEWLYVGDYKCPYPVEARNPEHDSNNGVEEAPARRAEQGKETRRHLLLDDPQSDFSLPEEVPDIGFELPSMEQPSPPTIKKTPAVDPLTPLKDLSWSGSRSLGKLSQTEEFEKWTGHQLWRPDQLDYEATFQTHAELYQLGCYYMLDELKNMAWQRLR